MDPTNIKQQQWQAWDSLLRRGCFVCFAIVSMATIGLATLAEPLAQYFNDQDSLRLHEQVVADLIELQHQQAQLLANSSNPAVIERVAIHHLKYQPAQAARAKSQTLTQSWQGLDRAVANLSEVSKEQPKNQPPGRWLIQTLAQQPKSQWLLFALGSTLVVISMIFFCNSEPRLESNTF